jgi:hypothetical protein
MALSPEIKLIARGLVLEVAMWMDNQQLLRQPGVGRRQPERYE